MRRLGQAVGVSMMSVGAAAWAAQTGGPPPSASWTRWAVPAAVALVVAIGAVLIAALRRREGAEWTPQPLEAEGEASRFEQLLAEIQGLALRVSGGAGRGFYRKLDLLGRIFLERLGQKGARTMNDAQLAQALRDCPLTEEQAKRLQTIFERCRQGAEHEGDKLDFSATELLREFRTLVQQADQAHTERRG